MKRDAGRIRFIGDWRYWQAASLRPMTEARTLEEVAPGDVCSLPFVGRTRIEDVVFYSVTGAVAVAGLVSWPTAALFATGHALHQRARNVARAGAFGEVRAGFLEAVDEVV